MELFQEKEEAFKLRTHQTEAVYKAEEGIADGKRILLDMATGTGKTIVFAEIMKRFNLRTGRKALALAHRDELVSQAISKIGRQTGKEVSREQGTIIANPKADFVVGSVQTLQNTRLIGWKENHFGMLVIDECHHSPAKTYKNIIEHFEVEALMGVSATLDRHDMKSLGEIFDEIVFRYPLHQAIRDGNLVPIRGKKVKDFDIDLSGLKVTAGDYSDSDLGRILTDYFSPIAHNIIKETETMKSLVFMPNVESSRLMAEELRSKGCNAGFLSGKHSKEERRNILYQFHSGGITHLCACDILTEGFDEPSIEAIVILRPTPSRPLFAQIVGRGTRLSPDTGKKEMLLLEFTYNSSRLQLVKAVDLFAAAGFEEKVRELANADAGDSIDFLSALEKAKEKYYSKEYVLERLITRDFGFVDFNPITLGEIFGQDLTGEFDIKWEGRKLEGMATAKQAELLNRYGVHDTKNLTKAQASVLISSLSDAGLIPYFGEITSGQLWKLKQLGVDGRGMMKAQASVLIGQLMKKVEEEDIKKNIQFDF